MILFTTDNENEYIAENADLRKFKTIEELRESVCQNPENFTEGDFYISDVQTDDFGDCWVKMYHDDKDIIDNLKEEAGDLWIETTHPGQVGIWITPKADVYVPVWTEKETL